MQCLLLPAHLAAVLARLSPGADHASRHGAHGGGALGVGHHGDGDLQQLGGQGAATRGGAPAVNLRPGLLTILVILYELNIFGIQNIVKN